MSNFTTEVRFICESLSGLEKSVGFDDVDEVLTQAAPKIFSFEFPIYDENYRLPLEKNILRHYYTREICEETVGLWKLRLNARMNEIMPYFNGLYESALIKYNPLYNVDYSDVFSEDKNKDISEKRTKSGEQNNTDSIEGSNEEKYSELGNSNLNKNLKEDKTENRTHKTIKDEETKTGTETETDNPLKYSKSIKDSGLSSENNNDEGVVETSGKNVNADSDNRLIKNSDTPQLGLNITNVEDDMYLTDVQSSAGSRNANTTSENKEKRKSGSSKENIYDNSSVESLSYEEPAVKEKEYNTKVTNSNETEDKSNSNNDSKENVSESNSNEGVRNNTNSSTKTGNKSYDETDENKGNIKDSNSYVKHVFGKNGWSSPAQMILDYRETLLNIDLMIIDRLADLFFGLYE